MVVVVMVKKNNRENSGIGTISLQFITSLTQTLSLGLDASGNGFNKWTLLLTNNLLGIPLIYCICGDTDDGSTSKFGGTNDVHVDILMNDVIGDDGTDGKSKAINGSQCSEQYHKKKKKAKNTKKNILHHIIK